MNKKIDYQYIKNETNHNPYSILSTLIQRHGQKGADIVGKICSGKTKISTEKFGEITLEFSKFFADYKEEVIMGKNTTSYSTTFFDIEAKNEKGDVLGSFQYNLSYDTHAEIFSTKIWNHDASTPELNRVFLEALDEISKAIGARYIVGPYPYKDEQLFKDMGYNLKKEYSHRDSYISKPQIEIEKCAPTIFDKIEIVDDNPSLKLEINQPENEIVC